MGAGYPLNEAAEAELAIARHERAEEARTVRTTQAPRELRVRRAGRAACGTAMCVRRENTPEVRRHVADRRVPAHRFMLVSQ